MAEVKPKPVDEVNEASEAPPKKKPATEVRYLGPATERVIRLEDWIAAGVPDQDALFLTRGDSIPLDRLSAKAQEVLGRDGNFRFE